MVLVGASAVLLALVIPAKAQVSAPRLEIRPPIASNDWVRLNSTFHSNAVLTLDASTDLLGWNAIGTLHDAIFDYPDAGMSNYPHRFYRLQAAARKSTDDWKNQILFPEEDFRSPDGFQSVRFVKFSILLSDPTRVFYQHTTNYPFHFEFATRRLPPFLGLDRASFDAVSLHRANQQVVLGAVLFPPRATFVEYGVQFVGLDAYTPDEIARWFELVKATIHADKGAGAVYMPTFEQSGVARTNAQDFAERGITVGSVERWIAGNHVYATGWALGRLKFFPAAEIQAAFTDGRLRPEDILLTDGVPAETPLVAGIISLTPSTPNSHTAILAQSFGIPFVHLPDAAERERVGALVGRKVILRATIVFNESDVKVVDVEGALTPELEAEMIALKRPPPIEFAPKQTFGAISASTDVLTPADIRFFGGKGANYGLLRRSVPTNCPPAIALSFDLWETFLQQVLPGGQTLRTEIATRLAPYTNYPPNIAALKTTLEGIRTLITGQARFTVAQQQAITNVLRVFDPQRRIRFRSSTNVEDSEHFTGAGLYDSYSGCLLDDHDGDTTGPSRCDPTENNERGVFRAIQRVYASFYNDNAFLERLRHGVDESRVGMGVLVHHSFPDEEELANGVATIEFRYGSQFSSLTGDMVTQLGAESVTNPDGSAVPESVDVFRVSTIVGLDLRQRSSRVPLGAFVMNWDDDYRDFVGLFKTVADAFHGFYPEKGRFYLDYEYKKDVNLGLVVKQVREIPNPATTNRTTTFLVDEPVQWCVAQREAGDVFGNHRLKSMWALHAANMRLAPPNLATGIYTRGSVDYVETGAVRTLSGPLNTWPNASNAPAGDINYWTTGNGAFRRHWTLETTFMTNVTGATPPIFTQNDFQCLLNVTYATAVPTVDPNGGEFTTTTSEIAVLEVCRPLRPGDILVQRRMEKPGVVDIVTTFYWPNEPPTAAGYTAPLVRFVETRITGLTSQAIVLTNYYSQTYRPGHHNFSEDFIFEPRLEPGLPAAVLQELEAANIQLIHAHWGIDPPPINALGLDQKLRKL